MNAKSLLIAASVLATSACAVSEQELTSASNDALAARVSLLGETYLSRDTFTVVENRRRPNGDYVQDAIVVRYRLRFIPAGTKSTKQVYGDYSYDGAGVMEYETVIDAVEVAKPALAFRDDVSYYAKRADENSFRLFDCDSTRRCADGERVSKMSVFKQNGRKVVKLTGIDVGAGGAGVYLEGVTTREILFDPTTAPAEPSDLATGMTCAANGHTLTVAPAAPPSTSGARYELRDGAGAVVDQDAYAPVTKDVLGHHAVVEPWSGLVISLGEGSARYENEVTGLALDFPAGTCKPAGR